MRADRLRGAILEPASTMLPGTRRRIRRARHYYQGNLSRTARARRRCLPTWAFALSPEPAAPCVVSRLASKGSRLLGAVLHGLLKDAGGTVRGRSELATRVHDSFIDLAGHFFLPAQFEVRSGSTSRFAHRIERVADVFLMPSRF